MTLDMMNDLYGKGLYSPINYYLGLLAILKDGADLDVVMDRVPETLLGTILGIAARHRKSEDRTSDCEENTITGKILAWGKTRSLATKPRPKASPPAPPSVNRLRIAYNLTVEQFALQLDVSPSTVASWERGERAPSKAVQAKLDALEAFLKEPRTGRRVASGGGQPRQNEHSPRRKSASRRSVAEDVPSKLRSEDEVETQRPLHIAAEKNRDGSNSTRRVAAKKRVRTVGKGDGSDDGGDEGVTKPKRRRSKPGDGASRGNR
jgi:DNA-binding transcriptional regulator YiaG